MQSSQGNLRLVNTMIYRRRKLQPLKGAANMSGCQSTNVSFDTSPRS